MEDASLDDFVDPGADDDAASGGAADAGRPDSRGNGPGTETDADAGAGGIGSDGDAGGATVEPPVDPAGVEPATPTVRWSPDGEPCAACGERVARRWQSGDGPVCADCVDW
jgi:hypothetical protein